MGSSVTRLARALLRHWLPSCGRHAACPVTRPAPPLVPLPAMPAPVADTSADGSGPRIPPYVPGARHALRRRP
jgi:hypothetical protein